MNRIAIAVAGLALLAGCGGPPTDASKTDFCDVLEIANHYDYDDREMVPVENWSEVAAKFTDASEKLEMTGTPKLASDEVRQALVDTVKAYEMYGSSDTQVEANKAVKAEFGKTLEGVYAPLRSYRRNECPMY